jgi:hypothetical protein
MLFSTVAPSSAAEVEVRLTDGRTLRGTVLEDSTSKEQLGLELRSSGITLRRSLAWNQIASVRVVPLAKRSTQPKPPPPTVGGGAEQFAVSTPAPVLPLSELVVSAQPISTTGKLDWDSLRLTMRGLDQRGQPVPVFGTLTVTLLGQRQEVVRTDKDQFVAVPRRVEQIATWTRSVDSLTERLAGTGVPVSARQGISGGAFEDVTSFPWNASGSSSQSVNNYLGQKATGFMGRQDRGRAIYRDDPADVVQLILPLPQPLPDQDPRRWPVGEVSVELLMPGVGVFSAAAPGVVLAHQSPLRQYQLGRTGTRFFPGEATTDHQQPFGDLTDRSLWPERRVLTVEP